MQIKPCNKYLPDDIVVLKHSGRENDSIPKYIVTIHFPNNKKQSFPNMVLCNRFECNTLHKIIEEAGREDVIEEFHNVLVKYYGNKWFYDLKEQYVFNPEQLELVYRKEK
jgi:hypothetical protein